MADFKAGDIVSHKYDKPPKAIATVLRVNEMGRLMTLKWHRKFDDFHVVDCEDYELANDRRCENDV